MFDSIYHKHVFISLFSPAVCDSVWGVWSYTGGLVVSYLVSESKFWDQNPNAYGSFPLIWISWMCVRMTDEFLFTHCPGLVSEGNLNRPKRLMWMTGITHTNQLLVLTSACAADDASELCFHMTCFSVQTVYSVTLVLWWFSINTQSVPAWISHDLISLLVLFLVHYH